MGLRAAQLRAYLRTSLWFIPTLCVFIGAAAAEVALRVDTTIDRDAGWFLFGGGKESARAVVTTIATSMLTFTGLVFSVTMLVLQLASNQLSPRVMRTFLRDRANQFVLGIFIATFVYSLLVLRRITDIADGETFVPALSVWLALVFVLISIGLFVYYIHHMAQAIRPTTVMANVGRELQENIQVLYPAPFAEGASGIDLPDGPPDSVVLSPGPSGVIVRIDEDELLEVAREQRAIIVLDHRVGDFVRAGAGLFQVYGPWNQEAGQKVVASVAFADEREMQQDALFGFRQLVDIAVRALSSGVNDPTTAVQVIDRLHAMLGELVHRDIPSPYRNIDGELALILPRPGWSDYVAIACDEIRLAGGDQLQVQRRLRHMLLDLIEVAAEERRPPLREQMRLLEEAYEREFVEAERTYAALPSLPDTSL